MKTILTILLCSFCLALQAGSDGGPKVGDRPPLLKATALLQAPAKAKLDAASLKGKVVVLEFWATWCGPCVAAIPHMNELAEKFKGQPVQFVAITAEEESVITPFLAKRPINAWIALDTDQAMKRAYGVSAIPHTVVIARDGTIAAITYPTSLKEEHIRELIKGKKTSLAKESMGFSVTAGKDPSGRTQLTPLFQILVRPAASTNSGSAWGGGNLTALDQTVWSILPIAFDHSPVHILTNTALPEGSFDFIISQPKGANRDVSGLLREALNSAFGLVGKTETRETEVMVLRLQDPNAPGLANSPTAAFSFNYGPNGVEGAGIAITALVPALEVVLKVPVLDETGLTNRYDLSLKWGDQERGKWPEPEAVKKVVREKLGIELVPARRPVEMVVIDKVQKDAK